MLLQFQAAYALFQLENFPYYVAFVLPIIYQLELSFLLMYLFQFCTPFFHPLENKILTFLILTDFRLNDKDSHPYIKKYLLPSQKVFFYDTCFPFSTSSTYQINLPV